MSTKRTIRRAFTPDEANFLMDVLDEAYELLSYKIGDARSFEHESGDVREWQEQQAKIKALLAHLAARGKAKR